MNQLFISLSGPQNEENHNVPEETFVDVSRVAILLPAVASLALRIVALGFWTMALTPGADLVVRSLRFRSRVFVSKMASSYSMRLTWIGMVPAPTQVRPCSLRKSDFQCTPEIGSRSDRGLNRHSLKCKRWSWH